MAITLEQAKGLQTWQVLHHATNKNADGTPQRWKVAGQIKTWPETPERVIVPVVGPVAREVRWDEKYYWTFLTENDLELVSLP